MMSNNRFFIVSIATACSIVLSLIVAYILFKYLQSSVEGQYESFKVGGAIGGFIVTNLLALNILTSLFNLISKSDADSLRKENEELRLKLLRGSPCPLGFVREIDDRIQLTFSRPENWRALPTQFLYQYREPETDGGFFSNFNIILHDERYIEPMYNANQKQFDRKSIDLKELYKLAAATMLAELAAHGLVNTTRTPNESFSIDDLLGAKFSIFYGLMDEGNKALENVTQIIAFIWLPHKLALLQLTCTSSQGKIDQSIDSFNSVINSIRSW
jgi:hypothetical protein